jgi:aspartyl-tRNA(Asn)/glutamyl-tRNA(Gln) amidotransferase subunit A
MQLLGKTIPELRKLLTSKQVKAQEIAQAHLAHLESVEPKVEAFITITADLALKQAKAIDEMVAAGKPLPALAAVPIALKDNICLPGYTTTCGSKILQDFKPPYAATVTKRLFDAGAVCVGKANLDEFAMGSSTEHSAYKQTKNPWDISKVPGGSSGGSAASVASGSSVVALGSDTGGSIRQPAALCGIVGMKPTYGLVSRFGLVAFASSLDQIGPFGRTVEDVATTLNVISGHDPSDSTSYHEQLPDYVEALQKGARGLRIGLIKELIGEGIDDDVRQAILNAVKVLEEQGAQVQEVSMPMLKHALPVYYLIATAEASSNLARYDGVKYGLRDSDAKDLLSMYFSTRAKGFGAEAKRRIMLGTYALSSGYYDAYYGKAQQVRRLIKEEFDKEFKKFDILLSPVSPSVAFGIGEKTEDPLAMYLTDIATIPVNLAGLPGISVPCGFGKGSMPIGLQMVAKPLGDATILAAAHAYEQATNWHDKNPPFLDPASSKADRKTDRRNA